MGSGRRRPRLNQPVAPAIEALPEKLCLDTGKGAAAWSYAYQRAWAANIVAYLPPRSMSSS